MSTYCPPIGQPYKYLPLLSRLALRFAEMWSGHVVTGVEPEKCHSHRLGDYQRLRALNHLFYGSKFHCPVYTVRKLSAEAPEYCTRIVDNDGTLQGLGTAYNKGTCKVGYAVETGHHVYNFATLERLRRFGLLYNFVPLGDALERLERDGKAELYGLIRSDKIVCVAIAKLKEPDRARVTLHLPKAADSDLLVGVVDNESHSLQEVWSMPAELFHQNYRQLIQD